MIEQRKGRGTRKNLVEASVERLRIMGPMTAIELTQELREHFNMDLSTWGLAQRLKSFGKEQISRRKILRSVYPYGSRKTILYHIPGDERASLWEEVE